MFLCGYGIPKENIQKDVIKRMFLITDTVYFEGKKKPNPNKLHSFKSSVFFFQFSLFSLNVPLFYKQNFNKKTNKLDQVRSKLKISTSEMVSMHFHSSNKLLLLKNSKENHNICFANLFGEFQCVCLVCMGCVCVYVCQFKSFIKTQKGFTC